MDRPVLVGMNNPLRSDPRYALYPAPSGVTGHRIWRMLNEASDAGIRDYLRVFDRRNVLNAIEWDKTAARAEGPRLWRQLGGRTVVLLGRDVLSSIGLQQTMPLEWHGPSPHKTGPQPARWCYLPHPSGLNHWYNDPVKRWAAALRLESLYEEYLSG